MSILSKKMMTCEKCGKQYEVRIALGPKLCRDCAKMTKEAKKEVIGYIDYAFSMELGTYSEEDYGKIAEHRKQILERIKNTNGNTEEAFYSVTLGAAYHPRFFAPTGFDRTIVEAEDIFAVGITSDYTYDAGRNEAMLCAVFTNDPYIPAIPLIYLGKLGLLDVLKSKKGRQNVAEFFELACPNLQYPVQNLKDLGKQIKADGAVKGNISYDQMMRIVKDAKNGAGIFNARNMTSEVTPGTFNMLSESGYIQEV